MSIRASNFPEIRPIPGIEICHLEHIFCAWWCSAGLQKNWLKWQQWRTVNFVCLCTRASQSDFFQWCRWLLGHNKAPFLICHVSKGLWKIGPLRCLHWTFLVIFKHCADKTSIFQCHIVCKLLKMSHLGFWHFPPIFVLFKLTYLVTLFYSKLHIFKNSPK